MAYYFRVGGPILWVLCAMSVIGFAIILERIAFYCRTERGMNAEFKQEINDYVSQGKIEEAIKLCEGTKGCVAATVKTFLKRSHPGQEVQDYESIAREIMLDSMKPLEKGLGHLSVIGALAPMCGLLGTVTGMIKAFIDISQMGAGNPAIVADGISEALVTTAAGLYVAIPILLAYNIFDRKVNRREEEVDKIIANIINIFRR